MSYIQASTPSEVTAIAFSFTPSQNPEYGLPDIPNDILITASPNTQNLLPVARLSEGFPSSISDTYTSPVIFTDGKTRILRFQVMQTVGNRANSHVFAMSEFQIHEAIIDETASPYYTKPEVKEAFDALQAQLQYMRSRISGKTVNAEDNNSLRQAIENAERSLDNSTEIINIAPNLSKGEEVIYNLSGQRLNKAQKGIYIINGRKVLR